MNRIILILTGCLLLPLFSFLDAQNISTVAGNHSFGPGYSGDSGPATIAELSGPLGVAFDREGNMYIADEGNRVIRKIDYSSGVISTVAGNNSFGPGYSGDGNSATLAELNYPQGVVIDTMGNIYIADASNNVIRRVDASTSNISTLAGNNAMGAGYSGDGNPATVAELNSPVNICLDGSGNLFIADENNNVIRKVDHSTEIISTVAGNGAAGYTGDRSAATLAELNNPTGVAVDANGNIYIADNNNQVIRKTDITSGIINTVAGNHSFGYSGDGGNATNAELDYPLDVKVDALGNMFIADQFNNVIREVEKSNGNINTIAGNYADGLGFSGDGGPATAAELNGPAGLTLDALGNLFIADAGNNVIRKVNSVTLGINKISSRSNELSIYPNPGNGLFNIEWSDVNNQAGRYQVSVIVYNVFGENVFESLLPQSPKSSLCEINLSGLSNGVYFIQIITTQGTVCKQVVIEK